MNTYEFWSVGIKKPEDIARIHANLSDISEQESFKDLKTEVNKVLERLQEFASNWHNEDS